MAYGETCLAADLEQVPTHYIGKRLYTADMRQFCRPEGCRLVLQIFVSVGYAATHADDTPRIHCLGGFGRSSARRERFHPCWAHRMRRACALAAGTIPKRPVIPSRGCLRRGSGPA